MLGCPWYTLTILHQHVGCRCPGAKISPGHQQPAGWLESCDYCVTWTFYVTYIWNISHYSYFDKSSTFHRGQEAVNSLVSLFLRGSTSKGNNAVCCLLFLTAVLWFASWKMCQYMVMLEQAWVTHEHCYELALNQEWIDGAVLFSKCWFGTKQG